MDKIYLLNICIYVNLILLIIFGVSCFTFNNESSKYFNIGWSDNLVYISISINTPVKYFLLCFFILILNSSEVILNDVAGPIITFSTYNPYKRNITDFTRNELEYYSNIISFIKLAKRLLEITVAITQIDLAIISLISYQISVTYVIQYLLNNKKFGDIKEVEVTYQSINLEEE